MLFQELDKDKKRAQLLLQYIPHVIPHKNVSGVGAEGGGWESVAWVAIGVGGGCVSGAFCDMELLLKCQLNKSLLLHPHLPQ